MLMPKGFTKTAGILNSMSRIFGKPYSATGLGYSPKDVNLGIRRVKWMKKKLMIYI